jgi:hypothetical protein
LSGSWKKEIILVYLCTYEEEMLKINEIFARNILRYARKDFMWG